MIMEMLYQNEYEENNGKYNHFIETERTKKKLKKIE